MCGAVLASGRGQTRQNLMCHDDLDLKGLGLVADVNDGSVADAAAREFI